jgi:hypothetical protein
MVSVEKHAILDEPDSLKAIPIYKLLFQSTPTFYRDQNTRLNDNTVDDAYNIPNKQEWINRIQGSKYFSKFDLKVGFWQVKMEEESIPWTAFTCPQGHYEWLVMPLGLKNAPALFQRKMQNFFNEN